jgi:hypothetical protein
MCDNCGDDDCSGMAISAIQFEYDLNGDWQMRGDAEAIVMLGCLAATVLDFADEYPDLVKARVAANNGEIWQLNTMLSLAAQIVQSVDRVIDRVEKEAKSSDAVD